jgi:hypothetical protein
MELLCLRRLLQDLQDWFGLLVGGQATQLFATGFRQQLIRLLLTSPLEAGLMRRGQWEQSSVMNSTTESDNNAGAGRAARLAKLDLARRLKVDPNEVIPKRIIPATWPDASLGCPEPDGVYAQAITSGYVILLSCRQNTYEYRTNVMGQTLVYVGLRDSKNLDL